MTFEYGKQGDDRGEKKKTVTVGQKAILHHQTAWPECGDGTLSHPSVTIPDPLKTPETTPFPKPASFPSDASLPVLLGLFTN